MSALLAAASAIYRPLLGPLAILDLCLFLVFRRKHAAHPAKAARRMRTISGASFLLTTSIWVGDLLHHPSSPLLAELVDFLTAHENAIGAAIPLAYVLIGLSGLILSTFPKLRETTRRLDLVVLVLGFSNLMYIILPGNLDGPIGNAFLAGSALGNLLLAALPAAGFLQTRKAPPAGGTPKP